MPERRSTGRGRPVGEPPGSGDPNTLDELSEHLRRLWQWSALPQRDIAEAVRQLRIQRGARPDEARLKPSQSSVSALFTTGRKRWGYDLLADVVRVLLDRSGLSAQWREAQVTRWLEAYRAVVDQPVSRIGVRHFRLGALRTPCQIIEGTGEEPIAEDLVVSRVPPLESPAVTLRLKHSDYYTFLATQQLDRAFRDGSTLRGSYLDGRDPLTVPDFLRSSFGLNAAAATGRGAAAGSGTPRPTRGSTVVWTARTAPHPTCSGPWRGGCERSCVSTRTNTRRGCWLSPW